MREILFRGKRIYNGEWVEGVYLGDYFGDKSFYYIRYDLENYRVFPETVGQFTGMCDKNGNRIFEGDIIEHVLKEFVGVVYFFEGAFVVKWVCENCFSYFDGNYIEVVGNIFDNPELLPT